MMRHQSALADSRSERARRKAAEWACRFRLGVAAAARELALVRPASASHWRGGAMRARYGGGGNDEERYDDDGVGWRLEPSEAAGVRVRRRLRQRIERAGRKRQRAECRLSGLRAVWRMHHRSPFVCSDSAAASVRVFGCARRLYRASACLSSRTPPSAARLSGRPVALRRVCCPACRPQAPARELRAIPVKAKANGRSERHTKLTGGGDGRGKHGQRKRVFVLAERRSHKRQFIIILRPKTRRNQARSNYLNSPPEPRKSLGY